MRYKLLTKNVNRNKTLKDNNDPLWNKVILLSVYPVMPIAVLSFGMLLIYNAPPYHSYPFIASCALLLFRKIYKIRQAFFERKPKDAQRVSGAVKIIFIVLSSLVVLSLLNLFFIKINI
ncbi:MAG: hypothetical protein J7539_03640 [Niabella sp.]|nr:hypothetical protein [Niabella sp.]